MATPQNPQRIRTQPTSIESAQRLTEERERERERQREREREGRDGGDTETEALLVSMLTINNRHRVMLALGHSWTTLHAEFWDNILQVQGVQGMLGVKRLMQALAAIERERRKFGV